MTENQNQPREYDAVKGGQNRPPIGSAVLGGIPGVKSRLASPILEVKIAALYQALKYRDADLDLIIWGLEDESMKVKLAAFSVLKERDELNIKQQFKKNLPTFEFDVITVDAEGKGKSRYRHYAHFFPENLGNGVVLEMVYIPGGIFMMGASAKEGAGLHEYPQHQVTVADFYASKYPITYAQWQAVMGNNLSSLYGEKRPFESASWDDAVEFCAKLSQKTGGKYRLLSEAEWEYACRAGTTTPFHFGETITTNLVNYDGNGPYPNAPKGRDRSKTTDVGSFPPNAFGLYDMHGNVCEWCSDRWHSSYDGAPTDGSSWETGTSDRRSVRGGCTFFDALLCRSSIRFGFPSDSNSNMGFRVAIASLFPSS